MDESDQSDTPNEDPKDPPVMQAADSEKGEEEDDDDSQDEEGDESNSNGAGNDAAPASSQLVPANPNVAAEAAMAAAYQGHATVDEAGLMINGVQISRKRKRSDSEEDQDEVHAVLYDHVYKLAKKLKDLRGAVNQAKSLFESIDDNDSPTSTSSSVPAASQPPESDAGAESSTQLTIRDSEVAQSSSSSAVVVANMEEDVTTTTATTPRAFVLSPSHKHAFLNRVRLCVESWTNKPITVDQATIVNCPNDSDFPHRLRWEKNGPPMRWVETAPRKTNLVVSMRPNSSGDGTLFDDEEAILNHANALLPRGHPKLTELRFVCYLVRGDAESGFEPKSRPQTTMDKSIFKNPSACTTFYDGQYTSAFFHHANGAPPVVKYNATMHNGRVTFKDICFSESCLTSHVLNESDGVWRLCIRSTHPGLTNLINFSVLTPPFCTGRRVRAVKVRKSKKKAAEEGATDES
jgi:hypothetical protein